MSHEQRDMCSKRGKQTTEKSIKMHEVSNAPQAIWVTTAISLLNICNRKMSTALTYAAQQQQQQ